LLWHWQNDCIFRNDGGAVGLLPGRPTATDPRRRRRSLVDVDEAASITYPRFKQGDQVMSSPLDKTILKLMSADDRAAFMIGKPHWQETTAKERRALRDLEGNDFVSAAVSHLLRFSSEKRAAEMLFLTRGKSPEVFWKIFLEVWSICDCTWKVRELLLHQLKSASAEICACPCRKPNSAGK
jgi:hypothetical protein